MMACRTDLRISRSQDVKEIERRARAALPIGSPVSDVEAYLRCNSVEFGRVPRKRRIQAIVRNVRGSWLLYSKSLQMVFDFDIFGRLAAARFEVSYTGL